jgi:hypothetical protein
MVRLKPDGIRMAMMRPPRISRGEQTRKMVMALRSCGIFWNMISSMCGGREALYHQDAARKRTNGTRSHLALYRSMVVRSSLSLRKDAVKKPKRPAIMIEKKVRKKRDGQWG